MKIINLLGQVIFSKQIMNDGVDNIIPVSITELKEGAYFIEITGFTDQPLSGRFIKQ